MDAMDIKVKIDCDDEDEPFLARKSENVNNSGIVGSCPKCGQTFKMRHCLLAHKLKCNRTKPNYTRNNYTDYKYAVKRAKNNSKPIKLFACDICSKLYRFKQTLDIHKDTAHKVGPGSTPSQFQCPKSFQTTHRLRLHLLCVHRLKESSLSCPQCGTKFVEENFLARHIRINKCESEPYKCPHCELDFEFKCSWKKHLENCDKLPLAFPCTFPNCPKVFTTKGRLDNHHFHAHPSPKPPPPPCPECNKQFSSKYSLQNHRKIHDPEYRKLNCSYCNRKFSKINKLRHHERFSRGESTDRKNQHCTQCSTTFSFKCQYQAHSPNQECKKCQLHFICRTIYMNHNCEGTPGPQAGGYPCFPCSKIFPALTNWRKHSYTHLYQSTGKKFPCLEPECGKFYNSFNGLRDHQRKFHRNKRKGRTQNESAHKPEVKPPGTKSKTPVLTSNVSTFSCESCNQTFAREISFQRHLKLNQAKNTRICEFCDTKFDLKCYQLHIKDQLTCSNSQNPKCDFSTNCKLSYVKHQESCSFKYALESEKAVKVEDVSYERKDFVESATVLDPGGPFYCWACGQLEFNLRASFYNHIRIVHGQEPE